MNKYRKTHKSKEILKILKKDHLDKSFLWQNIEDMRHIYHIDRINVNPIMEMLHIKLKNPIKLIQTQAVFYLKLAFNESICKLTYHAHSEKELILNFPEEMQTLELREYPRYKVVKGEKARATIIISSSVMARATQAQHLDIINISENGLCLKVTSKQLEHIKGSRIFSLSHIRSQAIDTKIPLSAIHYQAYQVFKGGKSNHLFKMGIKFHQHLPKGFIDEFSCFKMESS